MAKKIELDHDLIYIGDKTIEVQFISERIVTSTAFYGGGTRRDVKLIFNHDETDSHGVCTMRSEDMEEHMRILTSELGYDTDKSVGLSTAVSVSNSVIETVRYHDVDITAIVTAGVDVNGGRAGDPASFDEIIYMMERNNTVKNHNSKDFIKPGTINIMILIDAYLPEGTLNRVIMTATEAKAAALSELMARSMYSYDVATGSGTDGIIVASLSQASNRLTNAGNHSKLGEIIGKLIKKSVKRALYLHTGMDEKRQGTLDERVKRYGIDMDSLLKNHNVTMKQLHENLLVNSNMKYSVESLSNDISLMIHLLDQFRYELISREELRDRSVSILKMILDNTVDDNLLINLSCERLGSLFRFMDINHESVSKILEISIDMIVDIN